MTRREELIALIKEKMRQALLYWERKEREEMDEKEREMTKVRQEVAQQGQDRVAGRLSLGGEAEGPSRMGLQERVLNQLQANRLASRKAEQLEELLYLLRKNPETARILELLEITR